MRRLDKFIFYLLILFTGLSFICIESCDYIGSFRKCEVVSPDTVVNGYIVDEQFKFNVWYDVSYNADSFNFLSFHKVNRHETFVKILNYYNINSEQFQGMENTEIVATVIYVNDYTKGDIFITNNKTIGLLVYYVIHDTLQTRTYITNNRESRHINNLDARPKYLSTSDLYNLLSVFESSKDLLPSVISIFNISAVNDARMGLKDDFSNKIEEYLKE